MKRLVLSIFLAAIFVGAWGQQERKYIRQGNTQYQNDKYVESEEAFRKALDKDPKSFEAQFNIGDALYKQQKLNEALEQFQALAGSTTDKSRLASLYHNIGNIYFAAGKFDESINAYKTALKNNPADNETRYNLIAAQKMKQEQEQNKDNQNKDQQQEKQEQEQQKQEQQPQEQKQKEQEKQQQQNPDQMNKQDAERLLNAMQQDENDLQKDKRKVKAVEKAAIEKNW